MPAIVRAQINAHVSETVQLHEGEVWKADASLVRARPSYFSAPVDDPDGVFYASALGESSVIEEMTAEPGAQRSRTRDA